MRKKIKYILISLLLSFTTLAKDSLRVPLALVAVSGITSLSYFKQQQTDWHLRNFDGFRTHIDDYTQIVPLFLTLSLDIFGEKGKSSYRDKLAYSLISQVLFSGIVQGLKYVSYVRRPDQDDFLSFPSGHTATAFCGATLLSMEYKHKSIAYPIIGYTFAAGTGFLRMANNKHWLSDVCFGAAIGMGSAYVGQWIYSKIKSKKKTKIKG